MKHDEVIVLLASIATQQPMERSDATVLMWSESLDSDMQGDWAVRWAAKWFSNRTEQTDRLLPGILNKAWREHRRAERAIEQSGHPQMRCRRPGCECTHTQCVDGWLDIPGDKAVPCYTCRPTLAKTLDSIPPPGRRSAADMEALRNHAKAAH